ncbi:hypothetical protein NQZ68_023888 [Dissostichus eleginoides]|nr:hypothetical protein NQZ68_023888 [Dissostichus eleginoides]
MSVAGAHPPAHDMQRPIDPIPASATNPLQQPPLSQSQRRVRANLSQPEADPGEEAEVVVVSVEGEGEGDSPYRKTGEKKQSSPVQAVYSKTLLCLWLTEKSFWRLWCAATPHFSRQTALRQSHEPAKLPTSYMTLFSLRSFTLHAHAVKRAPPTARDNREMIQWGLQGYHNGRSMKVTMSPAHLLQNI